MNWMASDRFLAVCRHFNIGVDAIPLDVVLANGAAPGTQYFYLRWSAWASVIDLQRSRCTLERDLTTGDVLHQKYFPAVPVLNLVEAFVVDGGKVPEAAAFLCMDLGHALVCNEALRVTCQQAGLVGMACEDITSYTRIDFWD
nr:DUF1629 domain-containing protein [Stenotrophomonas sp.]